MKVAFVYDRINKFGGAERVLLALHELWPDAPLFTPIYNPESAPYANVFEVRTSYLSRWPFSLIPHEFLPPILPLFFESINFDAYDVVITVTSAEAKGIITKPQTLHICYCLTPTRYLWSGYRDYLGEPGLGLFNSVARFFITTIVPTLRRIDIISSFRPDEYIAISNAVATRIKKYYKRKAHVIYPPVNIETFVPSEKKTTGQYFLIVSRLVPYKRIDYAIKTFNKLGIPLKIIGSGIDRKRLQKQASKNIEFINGDLTDAKLCWYYQNCHALIFPGEEDFGIAAVEAQACGKPVIAYEQGGVAEIILSHVTGELYNEKTEGVLYDVVKNFDANRYLPDKCRSSALRFSKVKFKKLFKTAIENYWILQKK